MIRPQDLKWAVDQSEVVLESSNMDSDAARQIIINQIHLLKASSVILVKLNQLTNRKKGKGRNGGQVRNKS